MRGDLKDKLRHKCQNKTQKITYIIEYCMTSRLMTFLTPVSSRSPRPKKHSFRTDAGLSPLLNPQKTNSSSLIHPWLNRRRIIWITCITWILCFHFLKKDWNFPHRWLWAFMNKALTVNCFFMGSLRFLKSVREYRHQLVFLAGLHVLFFCCCS